MCFSAPLTIKSKPFSRSISRARNASSRQISSAIPEQCSLRAAATQKMLYFHALSDIQKAYSFWAIRFVSRCRKQIDTYIVDIYRNMADCLHRINMEKNTALMCDGNRFLYGFNRSDFVVGKYNGDKPCVFRNRIFQSLRRYDTFLIDWETDNLISYFAQKSTSIQNA